MTTGDSSQADGCWPLPSAVPDGQGRAGWAGLRAALFDMDGLLVDSEPLWFEVERAVMARLGGQWDPDDQRALLGGSLRRSVGYMLGKAAAGRPPGQPAADPAEVARWLLNGMTELMFARGLPLLPGAGELLAEVAAEGLPHALVTSSQRQIMSAALAVTGLRFPVTVCAEDVRRGKPDPEPYLRAASLLGAEPEGCVVLEDSPSGIASGQAAGCAVIAVPSMPLPGGQLPDRQPPDGPPPGGPLPGGILPGGPGWVRVRSLREVSLATLRAVAAWHQATRRAGNAPPPEHPPAGSPPDSTP